MSNLEKFFCWRKNALAASKAHPDKPHELSPLISQDEVSKMLDFITDLINEHARNVFKDFDIVMQLYLDGRRDDRLYRFFKSCRKPFLIYRSIVFMLTEERMIDPDLNNFIKLLGKFNDSFFLENNSYATKLRAAFNKIKDNSFPEHVPTSGFASRFGELKSEILHFFDEMEKKQSVDINSYHDLRKLLKHMLNYFQIFAYLNRDEISLHKFYEISQLVDVMGDTHDTAIQQSLKGEVEYIKYKVAIEAGLFSRVREALTLSQ
ncbi:MAG: hypothetical protein H6774_03355 [Pseudomonadales bacterium]|nr:hypothetical protein [Candidatus Woesebacteria bacterium]MCB9802100.1 hypothetical protein [Pseudomonadales bacterium]